MKKKSKFRETVESIAIALLIALIFRSFLIEPYKIPSSSMEPTLLVGDHIFVNKFVYGLRFPFTKTRFWDGRDPKRGEVLIFMFPNNEHQDYIKRVVGIPGDHIRIDQDRIFINDIEMKQQPLEISEDPEHNNQVLVKPSEPYPRMTPFGPWKSYNFSQEILDGKAHLTQYQKQREPNPLLDFYVPAGKYFVMGDNRDESYDSRSWGFVPRENIEGRAMFIWLSLSKESWNSENLFASLQNIVRWHRFGRWIH